MEEEEEEKKEEESRAECSDGSWESRNVIPASLFKHDCDLEQKQADAFSDQNETTWSLLELSR